MSNNIDLVLGGVRITVPIAVDAQTSTQAADMVNERLKLIESQHERVNTQHFALMSAFFFAEQLIIQQRNENAQNHEILTALETITTRLYELVNALPSPSTD